MPVSKRRRQQPQPCHVGDLVTTAYYRDEATVVRRVVDVRQDDNKFGSGWGIAADAGDPCPACGRPYGQAIHLVDAAHFKKVQHSDPSPPGGGLVVAFVQGAQWWEWQSRFVANGATMWPSDRDLATAEAEQRERDGRLGKVERREEAKDA